MEGPQATLLPSLGNFFTWWGRELSGLLPKSLASSPRSSLPGIILSVEDDGLRLLTARPVKLPGLPASGTVLPENEMLRRLGEIHRSTPIRSIGLRLPYQASFVRSVELPAAASDNLDALVAMNLERATPFKPKDVFAAHYIEKLQSSPGKILVRQLIVKRSALERLLGHFKAIGIELKSIDCWDENHAEALPINFLQKSSDRPASSTQNKIVVPLMAASAALLLASSIYFSIDKRENALQRLEAQTALLKVKAQRAREAQARNQAAMAEITSLYRLRSEAVSKVSLLEELTRLLPDNAYITDIKIDGGTVDLSGLAKGASGLIPILERSSMFVDATSTAPLTFDQQQDKERFSIRVHVRSAAADAPKPQETVQ